MRSPVLPGLLLITGASWSSVAFATLGEPESHIAAETQLGRASIKRADFGLYRVHEMQLPTGTLVREYASADGMVFAVSWNGPFTPDLRQSLGAYFAEFTAAAGAAGANGTSGTAAGVRTVRRDRKHLEVRQPDLVVVSGGHMRALHGLAYLPQALPSGVSVGDLQ